MVVEILLVLASLAFLWVVLGVIIFTMCPVYISRGCPWGAKLKILWSMAWVLPKVYFTHFQFPAVVLRAHPVTPEDEERFEAWRRSLCQCEDCRAERGQ